MNGSNTKGPLEVAHIRNTAETPTQLNQDKAEGRTAVREPTLGGTESGMEGRRPETARAPTYLCSDIVDRFHIYKPRRTHAGPSQWHNKVS